MLARGTTRAARQLTLLPRNVQPSICIRCASRMRRVIPTLSTLPAPNENKIARFHTTTIRKAQGPTADEVMENLNDLYATAKDEFEIAAEETEGNTIYAQDDRDAAREALTLLQDALEKALKESDPAVAQEVTKRVGQRVRELEGAVKAMEERAMEE